jgi:hypothetical protein
MWGVEENDIPGDSVLPGMSLQKKCGNRVLPAVYIRCSSLALATASVRLRTPSLA